MNSARIFLFALIPLFSSTFLSSAFAASPGDVVINEVAWMGTDASTADEWVELYNNSDSEFNLTGWGLYEGGGGTLIEPLEGVVAAHSYFLIERTDDNTVSDVAASQTPSGWGGYGLSNDGEHLVLKDNADGVVDEVDCSSGWFAGDNASKATMERTDPEASGSAELNWNDNDGVTVNGLDADGNPLRGTPKAQNSVYGQQQDEEEPDEELQITFTLPSSVTAGEGFDVPVTVRNAHPSGVYSAKAVIGESTESASLRKGYTYNSVLDQWLAWNGSWEDMPTFTTNTDGDASFTLKSKVAESAATSTFYYLVRIRKVGTTENIDSDSQTFSVSAASVTSDTSNSSDPEVIFSVVGESFKVDQSFDVKVNIKNAKPLHDYYVKVRLGSDPDTGSDPVLTRGRTYNGFLQDWLADNASWSKFPVVYTDGDGSESVTISAKVAADNPADTYIIGVRIRDKEAEDNFDSATQALAFSEEDPPDLSSEASAKAGAKEGAILGTLTELPATGAGTIGLGYLGLSLGLFLRIIAGSYILTCDRR